MHWSIFIILAGMLNAGMNAIYKKYATTDVVYFVWGGAMLVAAVMLGAYALTTQEVVLGNMLSLKNVILILMMGIMTPCVFILMLKAFARAGPLSLVDPMWACLYALASVIIGITFAYENPSIYALGGVSLYILGAYLMARG